MRFIENTELLEQERKRGPLPGFKRRCLQSMVVGQTSVFYPGDEEIGTELAIFKSVEEQRWIKDAGWKFSIETGCFVSRNDMTSRKCILITRTA